ncbi:DNA primase [Candidatus Kaiserbacteria bacterium]|nr:DNA primase [Candidatus Kaiserbacteria bacterium]
MALDSVQQIKDRLSIVDVVTPYVQLMPAGKNLKGKSPFTNEKTPSFYVSPDRGMYYCFSSSKGGDMFTFVEEMEGVDFKGALKILADKAGVELVPEDPQKRTERDNLYQVVEEATVWFEKNIEESKASIDYLLKRGVKETTIKKWRIGYAPGPPDASWRGLFEYLKLANYDKNLLLKAGLVKGADSGKEPYDVFRDRIMFPLFDASGRVVAFSGRILNVNPEAPKYVNSPETPLYNKSELLYGYDKAKNGIRHLDFSLIVEGQFDVVMCHQAGYSNTVAVSGTALTPHHVALLQRLSQKVVLALDGDRAGISAIKRSAEFMLSRGMDVKVATFPSGADPADIILKDVNAFKLAIKNATHVVPFLLGLHKEGSKDGRSYTLKVREEVLPFVARIPSALDEEYFVGVVAEAIGSTKEAVRQDMQRFKQKTDSPEIKPVISNEPNLKKDTNKAKDRLQDLEQYVAVMTTVLNDDLAKKVNKLLTNDLKIDLDKVLDTMSASKKSEFTFGLETKVADSSLQQLQEEVISAVTQLKALIFSARLAELKEALKLAEKENDGAKSGEILQKITELQNHNRNFDPEAVILG